MIAGNNVCHIVFVWTLLKHWVQDLFYVLNEIFDTVVVIPVLF